MSDQISSLKTKPIKKTDMLTDPLLCNSASSSTNPALCTSFSSLSTSSNSSVSSMPSMSSFSSPLITLSAPPPLSFTSPLADESRHLYNQYNDKIIVTHNILLTVRCQCHKGCENNQQKEINDERQFCITIESTDATPKITIKSPKNGDSDNEITDSLKRTIRKKRRPDHRDRYQCERRAEARRMIKNEVRWQQQTSLASSQKQTQRQQTQQKREKKAKKERSYNEELENKESGEDEYYKSPNQINKPTKSTKLIKCVFGDNQTLEPSFTLIEPSSPEFSISESEIDTVGSRNVSNLTLYPQEPIKKPLNIQLQSLPSTSINSIPKNPCIISLNQQQQKEKEKEKEFLFTNVNLSSEIFVTNLQHTACNFDYDNIDIPLPLSCYD